MNIGTFKVVFVMISIALLTFVQWITGIEFNTLSCTTAFVASMYILGDALFIKMYIAQNEALIEKLTKELTNESSDEPKE